jgi:hypothetical protein
LLARAQVAVSSWCTEDRRQAARIVDLTRDLQQLASRVDTGRLDSPRPWDGLYRWAEQSLSLEGQEFLVSLLLEIHGDLVDDLADGMAEDEEKYFAIDGRMTAGALLDLVERNYAWALGIDYRQPSANARFWYTSVEKLEPRLGKRFEEPGGDLEQPLSVARDLAALAADLAEQDKRRTVAAFLLERPERRHTVRRVQLSDGHVYGEVRENLLSDGFVPVDLLRCKLAFFGAARFDPKSDRWLRISMYQNAPYPDELGHADADDWLVPPCSAH